MTDPVGAPPAAVVKKYTAVDYAFQFVTVTGGVLIALLIDGLVEFNAKRQLVSEARTTIRQEVASNRKDLEATLSGITSDIQRFDAALAFAEDVLAARKITVSELKLHLNLADLLSSGWRTAERTGALSHMPYEEVQRYSLLYDFQELYTAQQQVLLGLLADASAITLSPGFDPEKPNARDIETFRERVMRVRSSLAIHEQMGRRLLERYSELLAK